MPRPVATVTFFEDRFLPLQIIKTMIKCGIMQYLIWVFTVYKSMHIEVTRLVYKGFFCISSLNFISFAQYINTYKANQ